MGCRDQINGHIKHCRDKEDNSYICVEYVPLGLSKWPRGGKIL
jgi:hypothetical protein